ncbi:hypothetical protein TNCV_2882431 [Trichonephila clavipes]|nr:hypothetical protein TNCV_2882431 [Trichonephila clavipes]
MEMRNKMVSEPLYCSEMTGTETSGIGSFHFSKDMLEYESSMLNGKEFVAEDNGILTQYGELEENLETSIPSKSRIAARQIFKYELQASLGEKKIKSKTAYQWTN